MLPLSLLCNLELPSEISKSVQSIQSLSHVWVFATLWTAALLVSLVHHQLLELAQICVHWVSDAIQPSPSPPAFSISQHQGLFQWVSNSQVLELQHQHHPSNEYSGLISFRMDWLDLLVVQGTLKSLLQHHNKSINGSVLSFFYGPTFTSIHDYWKKQLWLDGPLSAK